MLTGADWKSAMTDRADEIARDAIGVDDKYTDSLLVRITADITTYGNERYAEGLERAAEMCDARDEACRLKVRCHLRDAEDIRALKPKEEE